MWCIVNKPHIFYDSVGHPVNKFPGDKIEIKQRKLLKALIAQGTITPENEESKFYEIPCLKLSQSKQRIGLFAVTSQYYSGGRLHMYQLAWTIAKLGHEVFFVTDRKPKWSKDYPHTDNIKYVIEKTNPPKDLDIIITDGKGAAGNQALHYKQEHPAIPLVCVNFETTNWVKKYVPKVAQKMPELKHIYKYADAFICNSDESAKYLKEYMEDDNLVIGILPPATNNFACNEEVDNPLTKIELETPYIVWSARASKYKCHEHAIKAVLDYEKPLNLVSVGKPTCMPKSTDKHKFISFETPISDAQKMRLMRDASAVIAPSLFEGFGMVPAEALSNGTPVVVYELDVLKQNYGDKLIYAKWNNVEDFKEKLYSVLDSEKPVINSDEVKKEFGMEKMEERLLGIPYINVTAKRKITAQMICYYGPTVQEAIESVYPYVDEINIAYGPTQLWKDVAPDNSLDLINAYPDKDNKIKLEVRDVWENKRQMRDWCAKNATGNRMLIFDADEIYYGLEQWIEKDILFGCPRWVHFWHDLDHYVVDSPGMVRWGQVHSRGGTQHPHYRYSYWRNSFRFNNPKGTSAINMMEEKLANNGSCKDAVRRSPDTCIYHLGHVLAPDIMDSKHNFYLQRDGRNPERMRRKDAWHNWNGKLGECGDGTIKKVHWEIPEIVKRAFEKCQMMKESINA